MSAILLIGLIIFSSPERKAIWLAASQIVAVREPVAGECPKHGHTIIVTLSGRFCVHEHAADAARKVEQSK